MVEEGERDIFVVDSDEEWRVAVKTLLVHAGRKVYVFGNSTGCLEALSCKKTECNLVIVSLRLLPIGGLELITKIRVMRPSVPIIVLTSSGNATLAVKALKLGVYDFIEKPVASERLIASVQNALAECPGEHLPVKALLSRTEYEVLMHVLNGESTKDIAAIRHRSIRTIEDQRSAIMKKLKAGNLIDLVRRAAFVIMPLDKPRMHHFQQKPVR